MRLVSSTPLTKHDVMALRAGDSIFLRGDILIVEVPDGLENVQTTSVSPEIQEGSVCCLVNTRASEESGISCSVARVDEPGADRYVRLLLSRGARAVVGSGYCLATASYALRKYGGLFIAVEPDWIEQYVPLLGNILSEARSSGALRVLHVEQAHLTVAHDAHGRTQAANP